MSMAVSRYCTRVEKGIVAGGPPRPRSILAFAPRLPSGDAGAHRPVRLPCVLEGDSRGCGAGPQAHVGREVGAIIPVSSFGRASRSLDNFHRRGCNEIA